MYFASGVPSNHLNVSLFKSSSIWMPGLCDTSRPPLLALRYLSAFYSILGAVILFKSLLFSLLFLLINLDLWLSSCLLGFFVVNTIPSILSQLDVSGFLKINSLSSSYSSRTLGEYSSLVSALVYSAYVFFKPWFLRASFLFFSSSSNWRSAFLFSSLLLSSMLL